MERFLHSLQKTMAEPKPFGTFHLIAIAAVLFLTVILCLFFRNAKNGTYRALLLLIWVIMVLFEVVKQLYISSHFTSEGKIEWRYAWGAFPFQLCDAPFYVLPLIALLKKGKLREAVSTFYHTFVLLGGLLTYLTPTSITTTNVFLNIQTFLHHGLQIVSCIYVAVYNRRNIKISRFLLSIPVFLVAVSIATGLNIGLHRIAPHDTINLYFISPYFKKTSPLFNNKWQKVKGVWQILFYVGGMTVLAFVAFMIFYAAFRLLKCDKAKQKN